jgi:hypothetical protein
MGPAATAVYAEIERVLARTNRAYQEALVLLAAEMQRPITEGGNMPVDTGFLQSSLEASVVGTKPPLVPHPGGERYFYDATQVNAVLRTATIRRHRATLAYAAEYAQFANYDHRFRDLAVQKWPALVNQAVLALRTT